MTGLTTEPPQGRCAAGLLYRNGGLLLVRRASDGEEYPGVWDFPGGHCEGDESFDDAAARELKEELGVNPTMMLPAEGVRLEMSEDGVTFFELAVFLVLQWEGEPENLAPEETDLLCWFTFDEARDLDLAHPQYPALLDRLEQDLLAVTSMVEKLAAASRATRTHEERSRSASGRQLMFSEEELGVRVN